MLALVLMLFAHAGPLPLARPASHADGHWTTARPLPEPLLEAGGAVLDGKIYVAGGINGHGVPTAHAYRYDPAKDTWESIADLPAPRHHMPLVALGDMVYALGGLSGKDFRSERTVWAYSPGTGKWEARADLPRPRGAAAAAVVNGKIVVLGGLQRIADGGLVDVTVVYDPSTDTWRPGLPILTKRDHLAAATVKSIIYVLGGRLLSADRNYDYMETYDQGHDAWTKAEIMPSARGAFGAAELDNKVHLLGGENRTEVFAAHDVYDPAAKTWSQDAPLPTPRHGCVVVADRGKIYVIGGGVRPGFSESDLVEVFTP